MEIEDLEPGRDYRKYNSVHRVVVGQVIRNHCRTGLSTRHKALLAMTSWLGRYERGPLESSIRTRMHFLWLEADGRRLRGESAADLEPERKALRDSLISASRADWAAHDALPNDDGPSHLVVMSVKLFRAIKSGRKRESLAHAVWECDVRAATAEEIAAHPDA